MAAVLPFASRRRCLSGKHTHGLRWEELIWSKLSDGRQKLRSLAHGARRRHEHSSQRTETKRTPATDARGRNALYTDMQWNDSQRVRTWQAKRGYQWATRLEGEAGDDVEDGNCTLLLRGGCCRARCYGHLRVTCCVKVRSCPIARRRFCCVETNFRTGFNVNKWRMDWLDHIGWYFCVGYSKCICEDALFWRSTCVQNCVPTLL